MADQNWMAWAAGLFEGEGCFTFQKWKDRRYPVARLMTTDPDVIRRFHATIGMGTLCLVKGGSRPDHWKPIESWTLFGAENMKLFAEMIGPYLGERRSERLAELLAEPQPGRTRPNHCDRPIIASPSGRSAHVRRNEEVCERCRASAALYHKFKQREYAAAKREAA